MELQVGVKIAIKNKEGKILLLKRSNKYGGLQGQWDIVGGRINPGVSLIENLKREIKEETGMNWKNNAKLIAAQDILIPDRHVVRLTFVAEVQGNPKIKVDEEHVEYKWFYPKKLKRMSQRSLDKYFREVLSYPNLIP